MGNFANEKINPLKNKTIYQIVNEYNEEREFLKTLQHNYNIP